ncbi:MAG: FprA family A-type flavoprotein [Candidatus Zixiibacteriota bacterium]
MGAIKIAENVHWVGVRDPQLRKFDIIMNTRYGTTYNAYLVRGEKTALIDASKADFTGQFLDNVREIIPLSQIDYLVVNHTEPDHSGAITALLEENPRIDLLCSGAAIPFVKNVINLERPIRGVKDNEILDLGGKKLRFLLTPYMHWPDTMMEFLEEDGILFSCDGFAAHLSDDSLFTEAIEKDVDFEFHYYWDAIMRPFSNYIRKNLLKLDGLDIKIIAPSHGPVFRENPRQYIERYKDWTADKSAGRNLVTVFYASSYGNTKLLGESIGAGLMKEGFELSYCDAENCEPESVRAAIEASRGVLLGTPTMNGDAVKPIWDIINLFSTVSSVGKKAAVFGSFGWGGEGIKLVADRLSGLKLKVFEENFRARLVPSETELNEIAAYCSRLAAFLNS